jgi:ribosomal protein L37AE/L43A
MRYISNAARQRARDRADREERLEKARAAAQAHVARGSCPECGRDLRRNLALAGWWQCSQFGAVGFRADATQPSCDFQCFTE